MNSEFRLHLLPSLLPPSSFLLPRSFIPIDTKPAESIEDRLQRLSDVAALVGIVNTQNELSAMFFGEQIIKESGADSADMKIAGGTRSKTSADGHGVHCTRMLPEPQS